MGVTRFPNGIGFVKPGANSGVYTFVAGDQTPSVKQGHYFVTAASAITITNFDDGERGQFIAVACNSGGAVTIQNSAGGIFIPSNYVVNLSAGILKLTSTAGNVVMLDGEVLQFYHDGTDWSMVGTRMVDTTFV